MAYVFETSFEPELSEPEVTQVCNDAESSSELTVEVPVPKKNCRGKALPWEPYLTSDTGEVEYYVNKTDVEANASSFNYLKYSTTDKEHKYRCKSNDCTYKRKYTLDPETKTFFSKFVGSHDHTETTSVLAETRGLNPSQKKWVMEAFDLKKIGARDIISYFREKRSNPTTVEMVVDPKKDKLNNHIQALKKARKSMYNPSATDLKNWCLSHGPSTVNVDNEATYNTPFVLNYEVVSFLLLTQIQLSSKLKVSHNFLNNF